MLYSLDRGPIGPATPHRAHRPHGAQSAQLCGPQRPVCGSAVVQDEFHLSNAQIGYLTSAFLGFYMVAAPFVGPLADRYSRKLIIVLGALFWSGLTLLTAVTHTYTELLIRHTLVGVGEATFVTIAPTFVADLFSEEETRSDSRRVLPGDTCRVRRRISSGRQSCSHAWLAISVLHRRCARIPACRSRSVLERTGARTIRFVEGDAGARNNSVGWREIPPF